jgi:hypothetical protein
MRAYRWRLRCLLKKLGFQDYTVGLELLSLLILHVAWLGIRKHHEVDDGTVCASLTFEDRDLDDLQ